MQGRKDYICAALSTPKKKAAVIRRLSHSTLQAGII
jgi:hypothetical protein